MITAIADILLVAGVLVMVFGAGSSILVFSHRTSIDPHHPLRWFSETYTWWRWLTNPVKAALVVLIWQTNIQQLALTGPVSTFTGELDFRTRLYVTLANLLGASVVLYALHLKDWRLSIMTELVGYISLLGTLGLWVALVYITVPLPNTSYGLNSIEGLLIGSCIRGTSIVMFIRAERRNDVDKQLFWRWVLGGGRLDGD